MNGTDFKSIAQQLARRDQRRRAELKRMTPEERMDQFWQLQEHAFSILKQSPTGLEAFLRHNRRKRACRGGVTE